MGFITIKPPFGEYYLHFPSILSNSKKTTVCSFLGDLRVLGIFETWMKSQNFP